MDFIEHVDFSEWAASNGRVRICVELGVDYSTGLNEVLEVKPLFASNPRGIFVQFNGSAVFNIIDLSDAYLQLEVDDDSRNLLIINTHRGLSRLNRLATGVKLAPEEFQSLVDRMMEDIPRMIAEDLPSILSNANNKVPVSISALQKATSANAAPQTVIKHIRDGWPTTAVQLYFHRR